MSSSVVSTHAFFYTFACAPPCGDIVITPLLAVPVALCCIAVGARGRSLHLRLRARSSMRSRTVTRAPKHLRRPVCRSIGQSGPLGPACLLLLPSLLVIEVRHGTSRCDVHLQYCYSSRVDVSLRQASSPPQGNRRILRPCLGVRGSVESALLRMLVPASTAAVWG